MPDPSAEGTIPQSSALAEASPTSLSELMSRDPMGYSDQDLDQIVLELRAQRARWEEAEAAGRKPGAARALQTGAKATDLGL